MQLLHSCRLPGVDLSRELGTRLHLRRSGICKQQYIFKLSGEVIRSGSSSDNRRQQLWWCSPAGDITCVAKGKTP